MILYLSECAALIGLAIACGLAGYRCGRYSPRAALVAAALGFIALSIGPIAPLWPPLLRIRLPHPASAEFIGAGAFLFFGSALGLIKPQRRHFRVLAGTLACVWATWLVLPAVTRVILLPRWEGLPGGVGQAHMTQTTPHTCAPVCAATMLRSVGLDLSEGEMAAWCRSSWMGTSGIGLRVGVNAALRAHRRPAHQAVQYAGLRFDELTRQPRPLILLVYALSLDVGHAILYLGPDPEDPHRARIADPLQRAVQHLDAQQFARRYRWRYGQAVGLLAAD